MRLLLPPKEVVRPPLVDERPARFLPGAFPPAFSCSHPLQASARSTAFPGAPLPVPSEVRFPHPACLLLPSSSGLCLSPSAAAAFRPSRLRLSPSRCFGPAPRLVRNSAAASCCFLMATCARPSLRDPVRTSTTYVAVRRQWLFRVMHTQKHRILPN